MKRNALRRKALIAVRVRTEKETLWFVDWYVEFRGIRKGCEKGE